MSALSQFAISLVVAVSLAPPAVAGSIKTNENERGMAVPLSAGRPAGVRTAQSMSDLGTYGLAAGFAAVIIVAVASGPNNPAITTAAPSSTAQ